MAKTILEEAMEDAKLLKETAIENAKNVLVEAISPKIKEFVDSQLGESEMYEESPELEAEAGMPGLGMGMGLPVQEEPEKHADEKQDLEMLAQLLRKAGVLGAAPEMEEAKGHEEEEEEEMAEAKVQEEVDEAKEVDEVVEITNEDLKSALSEVLGSMNMKTEAHVSKGFGQAQDATIKNAGGKGEKGLADEKSGEHHWKDVEPPDAQDWTVKEAAYKKKVELLEKANAALRTENKEYKTACSFLKRNLQEVNLFNSKLLYTNKLLHSAELNNKQRLGVIEAFDRAQSLREVELVYKSLSESLKIAGVLGESKQPQKASLKGPKSSRFVTPSSTVLQESANREAGGDNFASRMQELAGLVD